MDQQPSAEWEDPLPVRSEIELFDLGAATAGALFMVLMLTFPLLHLLGETTTSAVGIVGYMGIFGTLGVLSWASNPYGRDLFNVGARAPDRTAETDRAALKAFFASWSVALVASALNLWTHPHASAETVVFIWVFVPMCFAGCYLLLSIPKGDDQR